MTARTSVALRPAGGPAEATRWAALAVLCVSLLIVNLDNTVLNVALPTLVRDLHATSSDLQWIVDSYIMVFAGLLLVAGSLADRVGRKRTFVAGLAAFAAGSAWAAFSGSVGMLIAARASSATNGTFMQVGGALGVAVIGSVLATRYTGRMTSLLAPYHLPHAVESSILGSVGGALGVAARVGGSTGALLAHAARIAFLSGMDLGLAIGAAVGLAGAIVALAAVPGRPRAATSATPGTGGWPSHGAPPGAGDQPRLGGPGPRSSPENDSNGTVNAPADTSAGHPHEEARR